MMLRTHFHVNLHNVPPHPVMNGVLVNANNIQAQTANKDPKQQKSAEISQTLFMTIVE